MRTVKTTLQPDSSDVEVRVYYYGQLKVHYWCPPAEAPRIAALWNDVPGMRCEISEAPTDADGRSIRHG